MDTFTLILLIVAFIVSLGFGIIFFFRLKNIEGKERISHVVAISICLFFLVFLLFMGVYLADTEKLTPTTNAFFSFFNAYFLASLFLLIPTVVSKNNEKKQKEELKSLIESAITSKHDETQVVLKELIRTVSKLQNNEHSPESSTFIKKRRNNKKKR